MRAALSEVEKGTAGGKREELAYTKSFVLDLSTKGGVEIKGLAKASSLNDTQHAPFGRV